MTVITWLLSIGAVAMTALLLALAIAWVRDRTALRRAGIGRDLPGCGVCLYPMRGWNGPICPECGSDVRKAGVRIRPRVTRWVWVATILVASMMVLIPVGEAIAIRFSTETNQLAVQRFDALGDTNFGIDLRTHRLTSSRPLSVGPRVTSTLTIDPAMTMEPMAVVLTVNGFEPPQPALGLDASQWRTLTIGPDDDVPLEDDLAAFIAEAIGASPTERLERQAALLRAQIVLSRENTNATVGMPTDLFAMAGAGTGTQARASGAGSMIALLAAILIALILAVLAGRLHRPGTRLPEEGEWLRTM